MGSSKDYPNITEWQSKPSGYHTGDMVKYKSNIFRAAYWAGKEPGVDPGWSLYDELYDETSHSPTQQAKVIGYLPVWRKDLDFASATTYQYITHGIIAFLMFDEANLGELNAASVTDIESVTERAVSAAHKCGTKISVAIGGATDYGLLNLLSAVGSNGSDARLEKAVENVTDFVNANAFDGVDLDLECWWDKNGDASKDQGGRPTSKGPHPAGTALVTFAQKLKAAMPGKVISATLFATSWYGNNYDPKLADHVDWLSVMTYDFTGSWNASPVGPHTALQKIRKQGQYAAEQQGPWPESGQTPSNDGLSASDNNPILSVEDSLWYWSNPFFVNWQGAGQKIPRNKIVAGVPLYGYDFAYAKDKDPESGQIPPGYKVVRYKDLLQQFPNITAAADANIKVTGNTARPGFVKAPGTYPFAHNVYFETPDTAVVKLNFLKQIGAQGVVLWEISNEVWESGKSIVEALYQASGNPATRRVLDPPVFHHPPPPGVTGPAGWSPEQGTKFGTTYAPSLIVYKDKLYAFHEGGGGYKNQLWYTGFDTGAKSWTSPQDTNTGFGTSYAPAVAVFKDKLYLVHEGAGESGQLWWAAFDGTEWSTKDTNLKFGTTGAPALTVFDDKLYCVHVGFRHSASESGQLWWSCFDGNKWSEDRQIANAVTYSETPALVVHDNNLVCIHRSTGGNIAFNSFIKGATGQADSWSHDVPIPASDANSAPSAASYGGKLRVFYETVNPHGSIDMAVYDASGWQSVKDAIGYTSGPPSIAVQDMLYAVHQGRDGNGEIWWFTLDGEQVSADLHLIGFAAHGAPSVISYKDQLYCVYEGAGKDDNHHIAWTTPRCQVVRLPG